MTKDMEINVLLNEYRACHLNRNHYSSVRWSIGSIFIVGSLTIIGLSITTDKEFTLTELIVIAIISILSTLVWYTYNRIITQYILLSIKRMHKIERKLQELKFDIRLHTSIYEFTQHNTWKGRYIAILFWIIVFVGWFIRFFLIYATELWLGLGFYSYYFRSNFDGNLLCVIRYFMSFSGSKNINTVTKTNSEILLNLRYFYFPDDFTRKYSL